MRPKNRGKVADVSHRLGTPQMPKPEWLIALPKDKLPQPERLAFPPGISAIDGKFQFMFNFEGFTNCFLYLQLN